MKFPRFRAQAARFAFVVSSVFCAPLLHAQTTISVSGNTVVCQGDSTQLTAAITDPSQTCNYSLFMFDTFGDGWNGAFLTMTVNGVATDYTFNNGDSLTATIPVFQGDTLEVSFTSGGFPNEEIYTLFDPFGNIVLQDGPTPQNGFIWSGTADCGGPGPDAFDVMWSPATGVSDPTILAPMFNPATTTTYTATVLDSLGTPLDSVSITVDVVPNFIIASSATPDALCLNGTSALDAQVTGGGTYTYDWNYGTLLDDSTIANPTATFSTFGNFDFEVTITSDSGCVNTASVPVFVSGSVPSQLILTDDTTCTGVPTDIVAEIEATVSATCDYQLQMVALGGNGWPGDLVEIYADGVLIHTGTVTSGFVQVDNINVADGQLIEINYIANTPGFGNVYEFLDPQGNTLFSDGPNPAPGFVFSTTAECGISYDGFEFSWSPATGLNTTSGDMVTATLTASQTYTVIAADTTCGYADTAMVTISAVPGFTYTVVPGDTGVCLGESVQFDIVPDTAATFDFAWHNAPVLTDSTIANPTATFDVPGTYDFDFTISSSWGCDIDDSFTIGVSTSMAPNVTITGGPNMCAGDSIHLTASTGPAAGTPCDYLIEMFDSFGDGWNGAECIVTVDGVSTTYTFTNGNFDSALIPVTHGASIEVEFTSGGFPEEESYIIYDADGNIVFQDGPDPANGSVFTGTASCGGNLGTVYLYDWQPNIWMDDNTVESPLVYPQADTTYIVTIIDSIGGCSDMDTVSLTLHTFQSVSLIPVVDTFCSGDLQSMQLFPSVTGGTFEGEGITDSLLGVWVPSAAGAGSHQITYLLNDFGSCVSGDSLTIEVLQSPASPITTETVVCEGEDLILEASAPVGDLEWFTDAQLTDFVGSGTPLNLGAEPVGSAVYWVVDANGQCESAPAALQWTVEATPTSGPISGETMVLSWTTELYNVPQTIGSTYNWSVAGGTISSGQGTNFVSVIWSSEGSGQLSVVEVSPNGCPGDTAVITVDIDPSSVLELAPAPRFALYPNPATDYTNLLLLDNSLRNSRIDVLDMAGRILYTTNILNNPVVQLPTGQLDAGVYVVRVAGTASGIQMLSVVR